ncbi:ABC transporter permease [Aureimonas frigidaquae]|uniref:ABC transporter permease n=1 Tax=Aureimonas frigidaquae TaxID=424757 RepID=UPI000781C77E|nr:ABC transporter permease [Aureimonas frigidaquae]
MALTAIFSRNEGAAPGARRRALLEFTLDNLVWVVFVIAFAAFSLTIPNFFQVSILLNILEQSTFIGILAVGLTLVVICGEMDLSIESTMALSAMASALLFGSNGAGLGLVIGNGFTTALLSILLALVIGGVVGFINAWLIVVWRINSFIVTLASFLWVRGLVVALSGGRSVYGMPDDIRWVAVNSFLGFPVLAWITGLTFLVFGIMLAKTPFGRHIIMVGGNAVAAYRAGIPVRRLMIIVFMLTGMIAGFTGWLLAARTSGATANLGTGMLFEVFAAVVIGGVSLKGGVGRLSGVIAGVLLLSSISTAINVMGMPPHYTQIIRGGLVLAAILLDTVKTSLRRQIA